MALSKKKRLNKYLKNDMKGKGVEHIASKVIRVLISKNESRADRLVYFIENSLNGLMTGKLLGKMKQNEDYKSVMERLIVKLTNALPIESL